MTFRPRRHRCGASLCNPAQATEAPHHATRPTRHPRLLRHARRHAAEEPLLDLPLHRQGHVAEARSDRRDARWLRAECEAALARMVEARHG
jgi:hypothetical protein